MTAQWKRGEEGRVLAQLRLAEWEVWATKQGGELLTEGTAQEGVQWFIKWLVSTPEGQLAREEIASFPRQLWLNFWQPMPTWEEKNDE